MFSGNTPAPKTSFQPLSYGTRVGNEMQSIQNRLVTSELANSTFQARSIITEGGDAQLPQELQNKSKPLTSTTEISLNSSSKGSNYDWAFSRNTSSEGVNLLRNGTYVDSTGNYPGKPKESKIEEITSQHDENINRAEEKDEEITSYSVKVEVSAPPLFQPKKKDDKQNPSKNSVTKRKTTLSYQPSAAPNPSALNGPSHLIASALPAAFPEHMAFRTLALYSTIRTLSIDLRLSPFTPNAFLRALSLPTHSRLIGEIHASILRLLFAHYDLGVYHYRGDGLSKLKLPPKKENDGISEYIARRDTLHPKAGENLLYLDHLTWPLYLLDFVQIADENADEEMESPLLDGGNDLDRFFQSKQSDIVKSQIKKSIQMLRSHAQISQASIPPQKKQRSEKIQNSTGNQFQADSIQSNRGEDQSPTKSTQSPSSDHHVLPTGPNLYQPYQHPMNHYQEYGQYQNPYQYYPYSYGPHSYGPHSYGPHSYGPHPHKPHPHGPHQFRQQSYGSDMNHSPYYRYPHPQGYPPHQRQGPGRFYPQTNNVVHEQANTSSHKKDESIDVDFSHQSEQIVRGDSTRLDNVQSQNRDIEMQNTNSDCEQKEQRRKTSSSAISHQPKNQQEELQKKRKHSALNCEISITRESVAEDDEHSKEYISLFDSVESYLSRKNPIPSILKSPRKGNLDKDYCKNSDTEDDSEHDECDDSLSERKQLERTAVQNPTKSAILQNFEQGKPYFKLSIATKVEILEYLIDELLDIELVKQQLDARKNLSQCHPTSYGKLPTSQELRELVNDDECKVCGLEGDLLCCDGCMASYHRECVDIQLSNIMSTDKWFCHECKIVDGCAFGPLDGGHKASLDWFSLGDLIQGEENLNEHDIQVGEENTATLPKWEQKLFSGIFDNVQFLIIHGYVFARHTNAKTKATIDMKSFLSYNKQDASSRLHLKIEDKSLKTSLNCTSSMVPLNQLELYMFLVALGPSRCTEWPWTQIPFNPDKLDDDWRRLGYDYRDVDSEKMLYLKKSKQQYYDFVHKTDTFNPYTYNNSYQRSSIHRLIESKMGKRKLKLSPKVLNMDNSLRYQLTRDMTGDNRLVQSLLSDDYYDPLSPIREYMTNLEKQLFRSTLLSEFWGLRSKSRDLHWWSNRVKNCKSIKVLCKLLIALIDETNSRAFITEWCILPGMSNDDLNTPTSDAPRNYTDVKTEWSEKEEKLRRNLERCHDSDLLKLIGHTSKTSNRKRRKAQKDLRVSKDKKSDEQEVKVESGLSGKFSRKARKTNAEENKNRRKSDRHHSIMNPTTCSTDELISDKLYKLEKQCSDIDTMENHWPIAGRKLFEPCGSLPKPVVKWLGRNGGFRHAPYVRYADKFEIGLPAASHIWRQKTLKSTTFEELIYQIRVLDSYLNKNVINSLDSLTRRVGQLKGSIQKVVKTSQIDVRTGTIEYFVVQRSKQRGCWLSSDIVEGSTFVIHRNARIQRLREKRYEEMRAREEKARLMREAILRQKRIEDSAKSKALTQFASDCDIRSILKIHENEVKRLMKECKEKGMTMVPTAMIKPWRDKHFNQMREVLKRKKIEIHDVTSLSSKLSDAEVAGTNAYIREATQALKEITPFSSKSSQSEDKPRTVNRVQNSTQSHVPPPVKDAFPEESSQSEAKSRTVNQFQNPTQTDIPPPTRGHNVKHNDQVDAMNKNRKELEQEIMKQQQLSRELERQQIQNEIKKKELEQQQIQNEIEKQKLKQQQIQQEIERQKLQEQKLQFQVGATNSSYAAPQSVLKTSQENADRSQQSVANCVNVNFDRFPFASAQYLQNQHHQQTLPLRQGYSNIGLLGQSASYPSSFNHQQNFNQQIGRLQNNLTSAASSLSLNHGLPSSLHQNIGQNGFNAPNSTAGHGADYAALLQLLQGVSGNPFGGGGSQGIVNNGSNLGQHGYAGSSSESQMNQNINFNNRFLG